MSTKIIEGSTVYAAGDQSVDNQEIGETYIVKAGIAYGLNPVGTRVWELIQQPVKVSQVRDSLLEEYDVDPGRCTEDLIALLNDLVDKGLAELQNAEAE